MPELADADEKVVAIAERMERASYGPRKILLPLCLLFLLEMRLQLEAQEAPRLLRRCAADLRARSRRSVGLCWTSASSRSA